jgi:hypothetical protein
MHEDPAPRRLPTCPSLKSDILALDIQDFGALVIDLRALPGGVDGFTKVGEEKSEECRVEATSLLWLRDWDSTRYLRTSTCDAAARASHVLPASESGGRAEEPHWAQPARGLSNSFCDDAAPQSRRALDMDRAKYKKMQDRARAFIEPFEASRAWRCSKSFARSKFMPSACSSLKFELKFSLLNGLRRIGRKLAGGNFSEFINRSCAKPCLRMRKSTPEVYGHHIFAPDQRN